MNLLHVVPFFVLLFAAAQMILTVKGGVRYGDGTCWNSQNSPLFYQALLFNLSPRSGLNVGYDLSKWKLKNNMKEPNINKTSKWWFKSSHHPSLSRFIRFLEPQAGTPQETRPTRLDFFASDEEDEDAWRRDGPRWWPPKGTKGTKGLRGKKTKHTLWWTYKKLLKMAIYSGYSH